MASSNYGAASRCAAEPRSSNCSAEPSRRRAAAQASGVTRIVRHNLTNIRFTDMTPQEARVACYFTVFTEIGLDHYGRYRDVFVPVDGEWLIRHRFVSTDWSASDSTMARR
jgi:hypothetical protein